MGWVPPKKGHTHICPEIWRVVSQESDSANSIFPVSVGFPLQKWVPKEQESGMRLGVPSFTALFGMAKEPKGHTRHVPTAPRSLSSPLARKNQWETTGICGGSLPQFLDAERTNAWITRTFSNHFCDRESPRPPLVLHPIVSHFKCQKLQPTWLLQRETYFPIFACSGLVGKVPSFQGCGIPRNWFLQPLLVMFGFSFSIDKGDRLLSAPPEKNKRRKKRNRKNGFCNGICCNLFNHLCASCGLVVEIQPLNC